MDVGAFVQENKQWLIGCVIGLVVWLIASSVLESVYDPSSALVSKAKLGALSKVYQQADLTRAQEEQTALASERKRLQKELAFVQADRFKLDGKGSPDQYLFKIGREMTQSILAAANDRDVQMPESGLQWDSGTGVDEIRSELFALELLDETQRRLFAAHDKVRAADPEAKGLRAITLLKLEPRRAHNSPARAPRVGEVALGDLLVQEKVMFQFQADEPTITAFVESCRLPDRTLVLEDWHLIKPLRPGETCSVKGTLQGIAFKD